ncbi:putative UDP-rhamnose:rhamnosyltransferase 1 [Elaeis guineensis]|uniref:Glycosyltransferase n=1 Tax=Elaeis guineensis var. tenera TaxID=51953 RepID=A0A6I9RIG7_ELAGV|nr:putative UDP-rhamnose:rhamnosyltransferase 1 [Elaeis guineensis]
MEDATTFHIVMLPWLAFGHLHPFFELSKSLAKRGHQISFISTTRNLRRLPDVPPHLSPLIRFVPLPLPHVDGLPDSAEATCDLPQSSFQYLKKAFDGLEQLFVQFINQSSPRADWIIHDFAAYWASKAGVPCIFYSTFPASTLAFFGRPSDMGKGGGSLKGLTGPSKRVPFPTTVAYRYHEAIRLALDCLQPNASGVPDWLRTKLSLENSKLVAPRSCTDFEADWFQVLLDIYDKPVVPVGLLPPQLPESGQRRDEKVFNFLDTQTPGSVIYVALGSEATIGGEQLHELALGLELSGLPFLWALRKPTSTVETGGIGLLPEGFEGRTQGRGLVAMGWVPQVDVLAHEAVGGFLTHCGWGSLIEGLEFGRPLVMLPVFADQGLNARAMGEKKLGLEVERDEENGFFVREAVAKAVKVVMVEEEGEVIRSKAKEMRGIFGDKERQERYVDGFVKCLAIHRLGTL